MEGWEQQQQQQQGRRLLPSPGPKKDYTTESDKARSVRLLLAKHPDQANQVLRGGRQRAGSPSKQTSSSSSETKATPTATPSSGSNVILSRHSEVSDDGGSDDMQFSGPSTNRMPGDSFPATAQNLVAFSLDDVDGLEADESNINGNTIDADVDDNTSEQELLKRLGQGQARMEQIKRMLVNQRGFIVEALKQLAESNSANRETKQQFMDQIKEQKENLNKMKLNQQKLAKDKYECSKCKSSQVQDSADDEESIERDRTLGKGTMVNFGLSNGSGSGPSNNNNNNMSSSSEEFEANNRKLEPDRKHQVANRMCPMCEVAFPSTVTEEDFESHVMEHFSFEETETLKYIPPEGNVYN